jgi:hypothetical protein
MEEARTIEIDNDEGAISYLIVGTHDQCMGKVQKLNKLAEGHWFEIGYFERNNVNPGRSLVVWKFMFKNFGPIPEKAIVASTEFVPTMRKKRPYKRK